MKARITVTLKPGVLDPQGRAIHHALESLGFGGVEGVRQGKLIELDLADGTDTVTMSLWFKPRAGGAGCRGAGA